MRNMLLEMFFCFLLLQVLADNVFQPTRDPKGPFLFSVDHCFAIRGQGTIMTGTILSGSVKINEVTWS
jgi:selenocysteine-specific elongation factor